MTYLTVKDEEGNLRPMAGIWRDDEGGQYASEHYISKPANANCTIVKIKIEEIE